MSKKRKIYTLLLGVDKCNKVHYNNDLMYLEAKQSVTNLYYLLRDKYKLPNSEYRNSVLLGENASWFNFKNYLKSIQTLSNKPKQEESLLFIYMIGHSSQFKEQPKKTFFCFHDQMVIRRELLMELGKIGKKFKIVWILDTCYAESFWEPKAPFKKGKRDRFPLFNTSKPESDITKETIFSMYEKMKGQINSKLNFDTEILFIPTSFKTKSSSNDGDFKMSYFANVLFQTSLEWIIKKKTGNYYDFLNEVIKCTSDSCDEDNRIELPNPEIMGTETEFFKKENFLYINN